MVATIADHQQQCDVTFFSEVLNEVQDIVEPEHLICVQGEVSEDQYTGGYRVLAKQALTVPQMQYDRTQVIHIYLSEDDTTPLLVNQLSDLLSQYSHGHCQVKLHYQHSKADVSLGLWASKGIKPQQALLDELKTLLAKPVQIDYLQG